jgi:UDP-N-acetylmuramate--alanine ligase
MSVECEKAIEAMLAGPAGHVHLMGVCGVGVAGVARLMAARGWRVSGCDAAVGPVAGWLEQAGVRVHGAHAAGHVDELLSQAVGGPALLVRTAAVPDDHAEVTRARLRGVPVVRRGELLAAWVSLTPSVAVCGTHGKTTTACFTARLLQELGAAPAWCIGGSTATLGGVAGVGAGGPLVVEADESDGTLARYRPSVTVVTNIDLDHMEHFAGESELVACFDAAVQATRVGVAWGADDARARAVAAGRPGCGFGFVAGSDLRATDVSAGADRVAFTVWWHGAALGRVELPVPGRHNVLNALGAMSAAILLGHDPAACLACLPRAAELPGRRFEQVAAGNGIRVISDYSHHPAEIAALMATARLQGAGRILAVFQPHRYTRTQALAADFPAAFDGVDELVLVPVYAASEEPLDGGRITDLYARFRALRPAQDVRLAPSLHEAWSHLRRVWRPGDLLLVVGAGDVVSIAGWAREALAHAGPAGVAAAWPPVAGARVEPGGRLAAWTMYGVGGAADWRVEVDTPAALGEVWQRAVAQEVPFRVLGGGANTLAADTGVAGVVVRMRGEAFRQFVRLGDSVEIGCGWNGPALLDRLEEEGLSGLEFLDGVPGQLGGWLAMNAGAHGGEIGRHVASIRCLNSDGTEAIVTPSVLRFGYRRCEGLVGRVALAVRLEMAARSPAEVRVMREAFRRQRIPLTGLRTAGSVFRNPAGESAGRLLDAAGCKGLRIGGAAVTPQHANVVACEVGATASDVLALVTAMRSRVGRQTGVWLEPEIRILGLTATDVALIEME